MGLWEELAAAMAIAASEEDVLAAVADVAAPAVDAELVNISILTDDGASLRLVTSRHTQRLVQEEFAVYSARAPLPTTDALLTGAPVLIHDQEERDQRYPMLKDVPVDQSSFAVLPLISDGQPLGVLGLGWRERQAFPPAQVATLVRVAEVSAAALNRTQTHQRERRARAVAEQAATRLRSLYDLTTRLAATLRAGDVAEILVDVCMPVLGASAATVTAFDGVRPARQLAAHGLPRDVAEVPPDVFAQLPLVNDIIAGRGPLLVTSHADRDRRYPYLAGSGVRQHAWANLPLRIDDRLVGIAAFGWDEPRAFSADDVDFLSSLATHTALALDRVQLLETSLARAETLQALQEVTAGLATAATRDQIGEVMVSHAVGLIAEYVVMAFRDPEAEGWRTVATPTMPAEVVQPFAVVPFAAAGLTPVTEAAASGAAVILNSIPEIASRYPAAVRSARLTGTQSLVAVPITVDGENVGALAFGFSGLGPVEPDVLSVATTLTELAGQALQRADLYESEHRVAHELQQALLPVISDELPGVQVGACYRPAEAGREIGGDWYDVFELPGGRVGFTVGDVVGHDLHAATVMGQLQTLLRSVAVMGADPTQVLDALDGACSRIEGAECATVGYGEYLPDEGLLRYACAGHPPLLVLHGRAASYLAGGRSQPIGVPGGPRPQSEVGVPAGSLLVWYSDGLTERRGEDSDVGFDRLAAAAEHLPGPDDADWAGPQRWAEALLAEMTAGRRIEDDIAVICLHLTEATGVRWSDATG